jgi:minor extracellular serine protease Vpr
MTGANVVQDSLGITGAGVKVAVIDTGIDYTHPDLGGCFGTGCRVVKGYDLVGDLYDANTNPFPVPDPDPMDCAGHGTHVSGIIGANGNFATGGVKGVAPGVTFYAYRVFGCVGSTSDSVMIDAMERALNDGAQVVNMSIGAAFGWPQWPTAMASDRLVKRGVVVVSSFGNSGANGLYSGGAPGLGSLVIGVASFDNTSVYDRRADFVVLVIRTVT